MSELAEVLLLWVYDRGGSDWLDVFVVCGKEPLE